MRADSQMFLQDWWYTTLLDANTVLCPPLREKIECDALVIGAGMSGLHAAHRLAKAGKQVVLLERNICGGSSTGKSAGFLTPDSELELHQLVRRFGLEDAKIVWGMAAHGVRIITENIGHHQIACDLVKEDSLFLGLGRSGEKAVHEEARFREKMGYASTVYNEHQLREVNPGKGYRAGIRYSGTYGINPLLYAQELKRVLMTQGVRVYESTPVTEITGHVVKTHLGSVKARDIILCIDKVPSSLGSISEYIYHAQTFLSISEPLSVSDMSKIFPLGRLMCWDSKLVYSYYRLTGDHRLLLGGGSPLATFSPRDVTSPSVISHVIQEFKERFPVLKDLEFLQYWPGRIDTTKDLIPIVDRDPHARHIQYVMGCVGLPWATFCGDYAAQRVLDPKLESHQKFLRADRGFLIPLVLQKIFGKMLSFSFNNFYSKYFQRGD